MYLYFNIDLIIRLMLKASLPYILKQYNSNKQHVYNTSKANIITGCGMAGTHSLRGPGPSAH